MPGPEKTQPTAEERAAIVAAYLRIGRVIDVPRDPSVSYGLTVVKRVLKEEGVLLPQGGRSPLYGHEDEIREAIAPLWGRGASWKEIGEALSPWGVKIVKQHAIYRIMQGIPRGKKRTGPRIPPSAVTVSQDPVDLAWLTGVFEARGALFRAAPDRGAHLRIGTEKDRALAEEIARIIGGGTVREKKTGKNDDSWHNQYILYGQGSISAVMQAIEPFVRTRGPVVRRFIEDVREKGRS